MKQVPALFKEDRGATAVLVALVMLVLIGFAALVVDWGFGTAERRTAQNAVDAAALGGAVEFTTTTDPDAVAEAVDEVYAKVAANGIVIPALDWASCTDPDALDRLTLTDLGIAGASDCISFSEDYTEIRVALPSTDVATVFGKLLGVDAIPVSAFAQAQIVPSFGGAFAFPAGSFSSAGGNEFCLKTGTGVDPSASCPGISSTGDFGNFKPYWYSGPSECNSGESAASMSRVMADGMDHELGLHPTGTPDGSDRINGDDCPTFGGPAKPNKVDSAAGYSNNDVTDGILLGGTFNGAFDGRLDGGTQGTVTYGTATIFGVSVDNRALWTYIDTSLTLPGPCVTAAAHPPIPADEAAYAAAWADMLQCLNDGPQVRFVPEILESPRLSVVPKYHESSPIPNNSCCYHVDELTPMWIQAVYMDSNSGPFQCGTAASDTVRLLAADNVCVHEPGMVGTISVPAPGQQKINSLSGVVIECTHLTEPVCVALTGGGGSAQFGLVELTR